MAEKKFGPAKYRGKGARGPADGIWFVGFIGALVYYLHNHSGTFWLVILAFLKALGWPAMVVYHLLGL
jgi:hypothetical protein